MLYPVLNMQVTPVVTANRHFHVTVPRFPCGSIRNIGFGGRDIHIVSCFERAAHPVVTANRHFHVTAFSRRCYSKHSIGMFCF